MLWFEFFKDDLPLWGYVGELHPDRNSDTNKHVLCTHKNINVKYNMDQIIHVNLTQESPRPLEVGKVLDMTYSVKWTPTDITFARRFDVYLDYSFFEHQIHWFSIFNSFVMVIFLTGLVSMILMRTLRNDYAKYAWEDDDLETLERDVSEESGWKLVHGDVFRPPRNLVILSAVVGTGEDSYNIYSVLCFHIIHIGLREWRNVFTSWRQKLDKVDDPYRITFPNYVLWDWLCFEHNCYFLRVSSCNSTWHDDGGLCYLGFHLFPCTVVGRNWSGAPDNPCRVKTIPRPIPEKKWYLTPSVVSIMGGLLPFGSIFIEMYFVFTSFWNYKVYYVYGFMLLVFVLTIVTVCVTIVGTYFLLNAENYHWQWTSFSSAASTAAYVYLY